MSKQLFYESIRDGLVPVRHRSFTNVIVSRYGFPRVSHTPTKKWAQESEVIVQKDIGTYEKGESILVSTMRLVHKTKKRLGGHPFVTHAFPEPKG